MGFNIGEMQPVYGRIALTQEANNRHSWISEVYCWYLLMLNSESVGNLR